MKKKLKNVKKVVKKSKQIKKKSTPVRHEIVVRVQPQAVPTSTELSEPMRDGKKLTVQKTWVSEGQLVKILQSTPPKYVYSRPGKGGGKFDYVTVSYIQKALNYIFGWNWDFEIMEHGIEGGQVWVKGRLTVRGTGANETIVKTQFGRADIKFKRGTKDMLDFGNDLKAATSDALKKCASMLGIASDIYGKSDYKEETNTEPREEVLQIAPKQSVAKAVEDVKQKYDLKEGQVIGPDNKPTYVCQEDSDPISDEVAAFSLKVYGKRLCREHQADAKRKK